jgi:hypothetical protein
MSFEGLQESRLEFAIELRADVSGNVVEGYLRLLERGFASQGNKAWGVGVDDAGQRVELVKRAQTG